MNQSAELIADESDPRSAIHAYTAGEMGAEAATRYLRSHPHHSQFHTRSRENGEGSLFQEIAGNALAAAFLFGVFLGRYVKQ
ncbi:hypothetical protein CfE428DRAFT_2069 [Chthoniobacter flavus Ellin428]|uniref:Uncharacterized protein n=1 Tax=Chthoniobacter flavus Ellin428 TaxID=497964 RepID=B4CZI1_9BACT|nr:hypothetical protein [Chthoniobacter flavus]EDY20145.1 hypothetical protein CfE428DRAFT_2069 [Chthoniobacter flavus Ellin428]TCO94043.1 hypothetical protein EV701_103130 [Chthoniobacter flavus]